SGTPAGSVGLAEAVSVAAGDVADFDGIFSFCPTEIRSVLRLLTARIALTEVWCSLAILISVSPDFTLYRCSPLDSTEAAAPTDAISFFVAAGICSFLPTCNLVSSTPGFASMIALDETPNFLPIVLKVSPLATAYSVAVAGAVFVASITGG